MIILKKNDENVLMFVNDSLISFNCVTSTCKEYKMPLPQQQVNSSQIRTLSSVCVSKTQDLIAIALHNKQLVIYDNRFNVVVNTVCKRAVSKITFTCDDDLLIADKTGDVLVYKFKNNEEPQLILGHLSMLLDIARSNCGKYVITSDRDEKIRVSSYPNAYNIVSYCLGHDEFVTNLEICGDVLISAGGDGTIRFWDFTSGKQLAVTNTNDHVLDKTIVEKFCNEMDSENVDITSLPITDMQVYKSESVTYLAASLLGLDGVQLYSVDLINQPNVKFIETVTVSTLLSFHLSEQLLILTNAELLAYNINENKCFVHDWCGKAFENYKHLLRNYVSHHHNIVSSLYKRKYDNVQDYLEKKKLRLENKS